MIRKKPAALMRTERLYLRLPVLNDHAEWVRIREESADFLQAWEPIRRADQHSYSQFKERVSWSRESFRTGRAMPLVIFRQSDDQLIGAITLDNIRRGPSMAATVGYWLGEPYTKEGYMREALERVVAYAFSELDLSRIEAAILEENTSSRRLLEKTGFRYEGVAQAYLQINGRWRQHLLFANIRRDRLGATETGIY